MTALGRFLAKLIGWSTFIGMVAVALMMVHITADVIGKFIFNAPIPATIAIVSNYYMVLLAFMPLAYAESRRAHISVEVLTELFLERAQYHLYSWTYLLSVLIFGLLTYRTWQEALINHEMGTFAMEQSTKMITWPSFYILPVGCGLMTIVVLYRLLVYITRAEDGIGVLLFLIALRVPIGVSLITVSFFGIWYLVGEKSAWGMLGVVPYNFAATWQLSSVPMFLLMGFFCYHAGLTQGLFDAARLWLGRLPGGLAVATVFGAAGFAAVTGSSVACAAAMGRIAVPEMIRAKYDAGLATGTVAAAGTIGALIPPSLLMILYGIIAEVPISHLFLGGIEAGLLTVVGYVTVIMFRAGVKPALAPRLNEPVSMAEKIAALKEIWPVVLLVIGVFGGLFGGLFTPTEAGAVGAALALLIAATKGSLTWLHFKNALLETMLTSGALFIIAIGASLLTRFLALSGAGDYLSELIVEAGAHWILLMIGISLIYLVLGMFLEPLGAMLLTLPIVLPVIDSTGLSLIWFGVLLTKFLEIGMITPPIGLNVFVIKGVVGDLATTSRIFYGVLWFLAADLIVVVLLMAFPGIILYLPSLMN